MIFSGPETLEKRMFSRCFLAGKSMVCAKSNRGRFLNRGNMLQDSAAAAPRGWPPSEKFSYPPGFQNRLDRQELLPRFGGGRKEMANRPDLARSALEKRFDFRDFETKNSKWPACFA
jgi:hypothetical protein